ncbi:MAG: D-Ala-D-Ala carboxypeptidase family metallohydrolase, partial [Flavobacteriaceae bacterium]
NPWSPFDYKVTPNITYGELTLSQESRRFNKQYQCDTALELCRFLEKARAAFGNKPLIITSGNRPPAVNQSVGGAKNSEHLYSAPNVGAVDFYIQGVDIYKLKNWCDKNWPYSLGYGAPKGFVHLGMREGKPRVRWDY